MADPRVSAMGQYAFVRVTTARPFDRLTWLVNIVASVGASTRGAVLAMACKSQFEDQHIAEVIVSSPLAPEEVAARAMAVHPLAQDEQARAVTAAIRNFEWFAECIAIAGGRDVVSYDPSHGVRVDGFAPGRTPAWRSVNAWVARHSETAELMHPRAPCVHSDSRRTELALMKLLEPGA